MNDQLPNDLIPKQIFPDVLFKNWVIGSLEFESKFKIQNSKLFLGFEL